MVHAKAELPTQTATKEIDNRIKENKSDNHNHETTRRDQQAPPPTHKGTLKKDLGRLEEEFNDEDQLVEHIKEEIRALFLTSHRCVLHHIGIPDQPPPSYVKNVLDHISTETYIGILPLIRQGPFMTRAHADAAIRDMINASIDRGLERVKLCARNEEARHLEICRSLRDTIQPQDDIDAELERHHALPDPWVGGDEGTGDDRVSLVLGSLGKG